MNKAEELCHSSGPWKKHKYFQKIGEGANAVYKYAKDNTAGRVTGEYYDKKAKEAEKKEEHYSDMKSMLWDAGAKSAEASWRANTERDRKINDEWLDNEAIPKYHKLNDKEIEAWKEKRKWEKKSENAPAKKVARAKEKAKKAYTGEDYKKSAEAVEKLGYGKGTSRYNELMNKYESAPRQKVSALKKSASKSVARGQAKINKLFKSETKVTVKDTFTGKTRTPSKPKSKSDTINIKQASEKNKKKKKKSNTSTNVNTFTLGPDGTTQAPANGKWRKVY